MHNFSKSYYMNSCNYQGSQVQYILNSTAFNVNLPFEEYESGMEQLLSSISKTQNTLLHVYLAKTTSNVSQVTIQ